VPPAAAPVCAAIVLAALLAAAPAAQRRAPGEDVGDLVSRVSERVVDWYGRAQSIVSTEDVLIQPLRFDMSPAGFGRRLAYELRVDWEPSGEVGTVPAPRILRQLLRVNGRPPREGDDPECMDPTAVTPEPLAMLLPDERHDYVFTVAGPARVDGREALMLDYRVARAGKGEVTFTEECVSVTPGRVSGRLWVDAETYDVLRLDERLVGLIDFTVPREHQRRGAARSMTLERSDTSIRYRRVSFQDPPETLMLPAQVDSVTVFRGNGTQRTRITQRFSGYRRFVADVRMLEP
jgi:hypothetical protein